MYNLFRNLLQTLTHSLNFFCEGSSHMKTLLSRQKKMVVQIISILVMTLVLPLIILAQSISLHSKSQFSYIMFFKFFHVPRIYYLFKNLLLTLSLYLNFIQLILFYLWRIRPHEKWALYFFFIIEWSSSFYLCQWMNLSFSLALMTWSSSLQSHLSCAISIFSTCIFK